MQMKKYKNIGLKMKRLLTLFVAIALFSAPAFSQKKDTYKVRTVVIDPGHGGVKPGAQGSRSQEKNITLSIAKKFGKLVSDNYPDVKVIYTRTTDVDISLAERAHIANRNKADLFISIHANSHPTAAPTGVETFVMGLSESRANLEVAKKENADILLEADYKSNEAYKGFDPNSPESYVMLAMFQNAYLDKSLNFAQAIQTQYKQNLKTINRGVKQAELFVLYKTTCPSVLTEVGFISNPTEEAFMLSDEGQAKIAISLFNAFMNFKATEEGINRIANPKIDIPGYAASAPAVAEKTETVEEPVKEEKVEKEVAPVKDEVAEAPKPVAAPERPVPTRELAPRVELPEEPVETQPAASPAEPKPTETVETRPAASPTETKPEPKPEPKPVPQPEPQPVLEPLAAPRNTAASPSEYFTVQFLTSGNEFKEGDPAFHGLQDVIVTHNGRFFCYSVGLFATFAEASEYCKEVQAKTPFKDAWPMRHKVEIKPEQLKETAEVKHEPKPTSTVETRPAASPTETKPTSTVETRPAASPTETKPTSTVETRPAASPTETKPTSTVETRPEPKPKTLAPEDKGTHYRIQFITSTRILKAGDADLHGIKDIRYSRNGKFYIYSCGNYKTLAEARKRLDNIKKNTPFTDAYIYGIKDGKRFNVE